MKFIADDGTEFSSYSECREYEESNKVDFCSMKPLLIKYNWIDYDTNMFNRFAEWESYEFITDFDKIDECAIINVTTDNEAKFLKRCYPCGSFDINNRGVMVWDDDSMTWITAAEAKVILKMK